MWREPAEISWRTRVPLEAYPEIFVFLGLIFSRVRERPQEEKSAGVWGDTGRHISVPLALSSRPSVAPQINKGKS